MVSVRRHARHWLTNITRGGLGLGLLLCSFLEQKHESQLASEKHSNSNQGTKKTAPAKIYESYDHATAEAHQTAEQHSWKTSRNIGCATLIFSIVAAGGTVGAFWQTWRQANISAKGSRPYVLPVIEGDSLIFGAGRMGIGDRIQAPAQYTGVVKFTNFGTVPAIIVHTEVFIHTTMKSYEMPVSASHVTGSIIESGKSTPIQPYTHIVAPDEYARLVVGSDALFISGAVFYTDVAGEPYSTIFCYLQPTHSHDLREGLQLVVGDPNCRVQAK